MSDDQDWTPAFEGQRPPFRAGNEAALQHGATSPRRVDPRAQALVEAMLADESLGYLKAPSYRPALLGWARAEARVQLLEEYLGHQVGDLESPRVLSAYTLLLKLQGRAESGRRQLGLDPLSRARLGKDVAQGRQADAAAIMAELHRQERQSGKAAPS